MNLVLTLLIELAILMSGCLAYLPRDIIRHETKRTTEFFNAQIGQSGGSAVVLSTIRTILDSLLTYHLPAEIALQSIDRDMKREIEHQYNGLIDCIDRWQEGLRQPVVARSGVGVPNEGFLVAKLFHAVLNWAEQYPLILDNYQWVREYPVMLEGYVRQKLFVVMFHASIMAQTTTVLINYEQTHAGPTVKEQSLSSTARFMSELDMGRMCVCEGIVLSVFLKRPYTLPDPFNQWQMADIKQRLDFESMWDGFDLDNETRRRITIYTQDTVIPDSLIERDRSESIMDPHPVPTLDLEMSHINYVYLNFLRESQGFQDILKDQAVMKPEHCQQLVKWTKLVWDRLCQPITEPEAAFKYNISKQMEDLIRKHENPTNSSPGSDAGPSVNN